MRQTNECVAIRPSSARSGEHPASPLGAARRRREPTISELERVAADVDVPPLEQLVAGSSLLAVYGTSLPRSCDPEEVAFLEFGYYAAQTYAYELVGFQILGEMSAAAYDAFFLNAFVDQSIDEAQHARAYATVLERLARTSDDPLLRVDVGPIGRALIGRAGPAETVVNSFCVLESLAMGIFSARQRAYRGTQLAELDRGILEDEARHQRVGVTLVRALLEDGQVSPSQLKDVVREGAEHVRRLLEPRALLERFDLPTAPTEEESAGLFAAGFLRTQREVTQRALLSSVRAVLASRRPS